MSTLSLDTLEQNFDSLKLDSTANLKAKLTASNKNFYTSVRPENGFYGVLETVKDNGIVERLGKTEQGFTFKEYLKDGILQTRREKLVDGRWLETKYDDNAVAYLQSKIKLGKTVALREGPSLLPNAKISKGNITTFTDAYGRPVKASVLDLTTGHLRDGMNSIKKDTTIFKRKDDQGDLIAKRFGGKSGPENIVPQNSHVNRGAIRRVEKIAADLKNEGRAVDFEIKVNYVGSNRRPSSFEPTIKVDGEVVDLPENLKKIYNFENQSNISKVTTNMGEKFGVAHETGLNAGRTAMMLTAAISTVDNIKGVFNGELSPQEAFVDVAGDTGKAGAMAYGVAFVSSKVASTMLASGNKLFQSLGKANVPSVAISFGIDSYRSVIDYAQGEIGGTELAKDLGESAVGVAGSMAGALKGAAAGTVAGPVGTVAGGLVGGMVGYAMATGAYATAIEVATKGIDVLTDKAAAIAKSAAGTYSVVSTAVDEGVQVIADVASNAASGIADTYTAVSITIAEGADILMRKAVEMGQAVIDSIANVVPEALDAVKGAMNDFAASLGVPIHL
jgi:hypothetical protein